MHKITNIAKFGRTFIPKKMRDILKLKLEEFSTIYLENMNNEIIIRPVHKKTSDAINKISKMNLPVDDWETMEHEITSSIQNPKN